MTPEQELAAALAELEKQNRETIHDLQQIRGTLMTKHTAGPWIAAESGEFEITVFAPWSSTNQAKDSDGYGDYRGIHICELRHQEDNTCVSKAAAMERAHLIAAAPEMYEALKNTEEWLVLSHGEPPSDHAKVNEHHRTIERIRAAIAKAEGK